MLRYEPLAERLAATSRFVNQHGPRGRHITASGDRPRPCRGKGRVNSDQNRAATSAIVPTDNTTPPAVSHNTSGDERPS